MIRGMEWLFCEEELKELGFFNLGKKIFGVTLLWHYNTWREPRRKMEILRLFTRA